MGVRISLVGWVLCGVCLAGAARAEFTRIVSFGDSLSDVGNIYAATGGLLPPSPYWEGRFSNGPNWLDRLADRLALPAPEPIFAGGSNYAFGGAESGTGFDSYFIPRVRTQVGLFGLLDAPGADDLFTIWAGANDFLGGQQNPLIPADNVGYAIAALAGAGARSFLVANLPPLGQTPRYLGTPAQSQLNALAAAYNARLASDLDTLESVFDIQVHRLDVAGLFAEMYADPLAYGFTNVTDRAYVGGAVVPNPDEYLFWDGIHPTRAAHVALAGAAAALLATHAPEPGTLGAVAVVAALTIARRRRPRL